jgi:hypothetical protein
LRIRPRRDKSIKENQAIKKIKAPFARAPLPSLAEGSGDAALPIY